MAVKAFSASVCADARAVRVMAARISETMLDFFMADFLSSFIFHCDSFLFARCSFSFFFVLGFDECFQVVEVCGPEDTVLVEPGVHGTEGLGVELVDAIAPFAVLTDKVSAAQEAKMLGNGRAREREGAGNLSGVLAAAA
jgi:hypothetical protein